MVKNSMKVKKFNSYIVESKLEEMPLLVRRNITKLVDASISSGVDINTILKLVESEFKAKSPKKSNRIDFSVLTDDEKEKMMMDALKMSEMEWMKKYKVGDHGDYLNRAKSKWGLN
jgi:hypothetical protein